VIIPHQPFVSLGPKGASVAEQRMLDPEELQSALGDDPGSEDRRVSIEHVKVINRPLLRSSSW